MSDVANIFFVITVL